MCDVRGGVHSHVHAHVNVGIRGVCVWEPTRESRHVHRYISVARACRGPLGCSCVDMHMCDGMRVKVQSYINVHTQAI